MRTPAVATNPRTMHLNAELCIIFSLYSVPVKMIAHRASSRNAWTNAKKRVAIPKDGDPRVPDVPNSPLSAYFSRETERVLRPPRA